MNVIYIFKNKNFYPNRFLGFWSNHSCFHLFSESFSYVWATAFGRDVGDSKKPITLSARYLASWLAFLSLVFVNVYVARLMAEIVKQEESKPFTSLQDPRVCGSMDAITWISLEKMPRKLETSIIIIINNVNLFSCSKVVLPLLSCLILLAL